MNYPDYEVQRSFNKGLIQYITGRGLQAEVAGNELIRALGQNDMTAFKEQIRSFLSSIPHTWHDRSDLGHFEAGYASLGFMIVFSRLKLT